MSNKTNFYISVDIDGKMPILTYHKPCKTHWIKYANNRPILGVLHEGQTKLWDYADERFYAIKKNTLDYKGDVMPVIGNFKSL